MSPLAVLGRAVARTLGGGPRGFVHRTDPAAHQAHQHSAARAAHLSQQPDAAKRQLAAKLFGDLH
jgi:hypothetical protein